MGYSLVHLDDIEPARAGGMTLPVVGVRRDGYEPRRSF
jgi:hypothetical protein